MLLVTCYNYKLHSLHAGVQLQQDLAPSVRQTSGLSFGKSITFQHVGGASPVLAYAAANSLPGRLQSMHHNMRT